MTAPARESGATVITDLPASARSRWHVDQMVTNQIKVDGRTAFYASGGRGLPVLFLHGWGLDHRAYQRSLTRLTARGCRVIAPSMPGFGGTAALPAAERDIEGYAAWVSAFIDASAFSKYGPHFSSTQCRSLTAMKEKSSPAAASAASSAPGQMLAASNADAPTFSNRRRDSGKGVIMLELYRG